MRAAFRIEIDGSQDITAAVDSRLRHLAVTDAVGIASDTALVDVAAKGLSLPRRGAEMAISLGWQGAVADMGTYIVDGATLSSPPLQMQIRATAADLRGKLKVRRTASWDAATLGDVLGDTASAAGLDARVAPELSRIPISHLDQDAESGLQLLTRLAERHDFGWRVWGGRLAAIPLAGGVSASGNDARPIAIGPPVASWKLRISDRPRYESVIAKWRDTEESDTMTVTAGSGEPQYVLRWIIPTRAEAQAAAASKLVALRREAEALDLSPAVADPRLRALAKLRLNDLHADIDGAWTCSRAMHEIDERRGYTCSIEAYKAA